MTHARALAMARGRRTGDLSRYQSGNGLAVCGCLGSPPWEPVCRRPVFDPNRDRTFAVHRAGCRHDLGVGPRHRPQLAADGRRMRVDPVGVVSLGVWLSPTRIGMQAGSSGLMAWSFLMASAHGAGIMLVPAMVPLCSSVNAAGEITAGGSLITSF